MDDTGKIRPEQYCGIHIIPAGGRQHQDSADCWCCPKLEYRDRMSGKSVYVHKKPEEGH